MLREWCNSIFERINKLFYMNLYTEPWFQYSPIEARASLGRTDIDPHYPAQVPENICILS